MSHSIKPIHPGEVLLEVYMKPSCPELTVQTLAQALHVPPRSLTALINGRRAVTPSMAMRLGVVCRTTPDYWLGLQKTYNVQIARKKGAQVRRHKETHNSHSAAAA